MNLPLSIRLFVTILCTGILCISCGKSQTSVIPPPIPTAFDSVKNLGGSWLCSGFVYYSKAVAVDSINGLYNYVDDKLYITSDTINIRFPGNNADSLVLTVGSYDGRNYHWNSTSYGRKFRDNSNHTISYSWDIGPAYTLVRHEQYICYYYLRDSIVFSEQYGYALGAYNNSKFYLTSSTKF